MFLAAVAAFYETPANYTLRDPAPPNLPGPAPPSQAAQEFPVTVAWAAARHKLQPLWRLQYEKTARTRLADTMH